MIASDSDSNATKVTSLSVRVTVLTIFVSGALALLLIPVSKFPAPQMPGLIPLFVAGIFFAQSPTAFLLILCTVDNVGGLYCCWAAPTQL
jgi:hypothetical protein